MSDPGSVQPDTQGNEFLLGGDGDEYQVWVATLDQIAASGNRSVASLDGLVGKWHVLGDHDVNVFNLGHG